MKKSQAIAAYSFQGDTSARQLSMQVNDPLRIIQASETGWFWGTNLRTAQTGWFPGSFVRIEQNRGARCNHQAPINTAETNNGFNGAIMGGEIQNPWIPKTEISRQLPVSTQESNNVTVIPVPEGPKPQSTVKQTGWIVSKTARRTGKALSKVSHKFSKSILKQDEKRNREIIRPYVRRTSEVENLSAVLRLGGS